MPRLIFSGNHIALIVRGKTSPTHTPSNFSQHADCILSTGSPIGFFGEGNDGSGNRSGLGMNGVVYNFDKLRENRPYYIDATIARGNAVKSTVLIIYVSSQTAKKFDDAWNDLSKKPPSFWLAGANCSTRAASVFQKSGILNSGIPGLDTPNNLYNQLSIVCATRSWSYSGYVGFETSATGYNVVIDP